MENRMQEQTEETNTQETMGTETETTNSETAELKSLLNAYVHELNGVRRTMLESFVGTLKKSFGSDVSIVINGLGIVVTSASQNKTLEDSVKVILANLELLKTKEAEEASAKSETATEQ